MRRRLFLVKLAGIPLAVLAWPPRLGRGPMTWEMEIEVALPTDVVLQTPHANHFVVGDIIVVTNPFERMQVVHVEPTAISVIRNV